MKPFSILLPVLLACTTHAQRVERQGFIVRSKGDTLYGSVGSRGWKETPRYFYFSSEGRPHGPVRIAPRDVQEVVAGNQKYRSMPITSAPEFLQVVVEGNRLMLYKVDWGEGPVFLIGAPQAARPVTLRQTPMLDPSPFRGTVKEYQVQLYHAIERDQRAVGLFVPMIQDCPYDEPGLARLVISVNHYYEDTAARAALPPKKSCWNVFLRVGALRQSVSMEGLAASTGQMRFNHPTVATVEVGMQLHDDLNMPRWTGQFSLQYYTSAVLGIGKPTGYAEVDSTVLSYRQNTYSFSGGALFQLLPVGHQSRVFELRAGLSLVGFIASYPRDEYQQYFNGRPISTGYLGNQPALWQWGGFVEPKLSFCFPTARFEFNVIYRLPSFLGTTEDYDYTLNQSFAGVMLAYHFKPFRSR